MHGFIRYLTLISAVAALSFLSLGREARAGCAPAPSVKDDVLSCNAATPPDPTAATVNASKGNDQITVDSGTYSDFIGGAGNDSFTLNGGIIGSITDTVGLSNTLILTPGSTATITGDVTFDETLDRLEVHAGTITGHVETGIGVDTLIMTGGVIGSIDQGVGRDHATVSGGRIVGAFNDGDIFTMTGGQIGSVDLKTGTNIMRMSGGQIDLNVNAEQGDDTLELSGGSIGGNVNVGSGNDKITVTGGAIGGQVLTEAGIDSFTWADGGTIGGAVDLGADDDGAILRNLTNVLLSSTPPIDGNLGTDRLTFDNTLATGVGRFQRWETVDLTNGTQLTLDTNLTLGDAGTGTGSLSIDATSTLFAGGGNNSSILPFTSGQLVSVANGGTIDLTNGGDITTDSLTIVGNYSGASDLLLNTVLGADGSPSDKLVIDSGTATGKTTIGVVNVGGAGALTKSDGILLVEAVNGATTAGDAFAQGNRVAAGAFEYLLFRGGVAGAAPDNWHLRSTLVPGSAPPAARRALDPRAAPAPGEPAPPPAPGEPAALLAPGLVLALPAPPAPGEPPIPLLRPEVPVYSAVLPTARALGILTLGTFHERQGEQSLLSGTGLVAATWGRAFGEKREDSWSGLAAPEFDGTLFGFQAGLDLAGFVSSRGDERDHLGVFVGYARADGDIDGFAVGQQRQVGDLGFNAYSIGAYGTHVGAGAWYLDAVLMGSFFDGKASSDFGAAADPDGTGVTASLEGGYPIALGAGLTLEPQAQLIWQHLDLDDTADPFSTVEYDTADAFIGRVGARLQGEVQAGSVPLQPYVKLNVWQQVGGDDAVIFGGANEIETKNRMTAIEVGAGVVAQVSKSFGLYAVVDYTTDVADNDTEVIQGNLGVRVTW